MRNLLLSIKVIHRTSQAFVFVTPVVGQLLRPSGHLQPPIRRLTESSRQIEVTPGRDRAEV